MPRRSKFSGSIVSSSYSPRLNSPSKAPASVVGSAEKALKSAGSDRKNVIKRAISSSPNKSPFGQGKSGRKVRSGAIKAGLSGNKAASTSSASGGINYLGTRSSSVNAMHKYRGRKPKAGGIKSP